jgi:hypothetical protein
MGEPPSPVTVAPRLSDWNERTILCSITSAVDCTKHNLICWCLLTRAFADDFNEVHDNSQGHNKLTTFLRKFAVNQVYLVSWFDSRRYQIFWEVGLERGSLILLRIIEELLEWKSSGSGLETRD